MELEIMGIKTSYWQHGEGKPIVNIHGYGLDHRVMEGCIEPVFSKIDNADNEWKRIYFDLPGMGTSEGADKISCADEMLSFVLSFIDKIVGDEDFILVGYSYGGYLARAVAAKREKQVDRLFLLCPVVIPDKRRRKLTPHTVLEHDSEFMNQLSKSEVKDFEDFFVIQNRYTWERYLKEIKPALVEVDNDFIRRYYKEGYVFSFDKYDQGKYFDNFEGPTVILTGRQDSVVGYEDVFPILEHYPKGTFIVLNGGGHSLQIEQESEFNHIFRNLLY